MTATLYTFEFVDGTPDFWRLSDSQLAESCVCMAEGQFPQARAFHRAEAMRLFLLWHDVTNGGCGTREDREERAGALNALRKRTIQMLVRVSLPCFAPAAN